MGGKGKLDIHLFTAYGQESGTLRDRSSSSRGGTQRNRREWRTEKRRAQKRTRKISLHKNVSLLWSHNNVIFVSFLRFCIFLFIFVCITNIFFLMALLRSPDLSTLTTVLPLALVQPWFYLAQYLPHFHPWTDSKSPKYQLTSTRLHCATSQKTAFSGKLWY